MESRYPVYQRFLFGVLFVIVVLAIFPLTPNPANEIKVLAYQLFAFPMLMLWFAHSGKRLRWPATPSSLSFLVGAFMVMAFLASVFSLNSGYSLLGEFAKLASLFVLYVAAADAFRTPQHAWKFAGVACVGASVASLYGFVQYAGLDPFPWQDTTGMLRSAPATFGNPNYASHVLAPLLVVGIGLSFQARRRWGILCVLIFLLHFSLTRTRGSILALAAVGVLVLAAVVLFRQRLKPARAVLLTVAVVFIACAGAVGSVMSYSYFTQGRAYPYGQGTSITCRYHSFYGASVAVPESPLLGHGLGTYRFVSPKYWTPFEQEYFKATNKMNTHVHNEPLEIAFDAGIPAAILYVAIFLFGMVSCLFIWFSSGEFRLRSLGLTLAAFYLCFFVDGLFGFNFHLPVSQLLLFILLGATAGVLKGGDAGEKTPSASPDACAVFVRVAVVLSLMLPVLGVRNFAAQFLSQRARGAYDQEFYAEAAQIYAKAAALAPYDWNNFHWQGLASRRINENENAVACFRRATSLNPFDYHTQRAMAEAALALAVSSRDAGLFEEGASAARQAIELNPLMPDPYELLAETIILHFRLPTVPGIDDSYKRRVGSLKEAEGHLLKAIELGSERKARAYNLITRIRAERHDYAGAFSALALSLEDKRDDTGVWLHFLQLSRADNNYTPILASLDRHLPLLEESDGTPASVMAHLNILRAQVLLDGFGDEDGAKEIFAHLAERYPEEAAVWSHFHAFSRLTGREMDFHAALQALFNRQQDEELELPPVVHAAAAGGAGGADYLIKAVAVIIELLERDQGSGIGVEEVAQKYSWAADVIAERAKMLELSPETGGYVFENLGIAYGAWNDFRAAADLLNRALPYLPEHQTVQCLARIASALTIQGETDGAVEVLERAKSLDPYNFEVRYALADALAQAGQEAKAATEYGSLIEQFQLTDEGLRLIRKKLEEVSSRAQADARRQ